MSGLPFSAAAEPQAFEIDPNHTHVHWEVRHFGTSTSRGRFDDILGHLSLDRAARQGSVGLTIATGSQSTGVAPFDSVLRGAHLLATKEHPTAYFVASRFGFDKDQLVSVTGEFTLRGVGDAVTLRALRFSCREKDLPTPREVCGGDFETEIQRSRFGITHSLPFVADRVHILVQIEASRPR